MKKINGNIDVKNTQGIKYFSMFSGIGGFELGIQQAYESILHKPQNDELQIERNSGCDNGNGLQRTASCCIGYSEIDKYAVQVYLKHFPNHKNYGDCTTINPAELPDFDLIVGGFPCQSFSIAGKRGGFEDTRGTLFFHIARIAKVKRPKYLLLENVKGLLSHDKGNTFATIISTLDELGYDCQWNVLNSKNFGVPQNRERVFIVGHLRGESRPKIFPIGEGNEISDARGERETETANTISANYWKGVGANRPFIQQLNNPKHSNNRIYGIAGVSPTLNTAQGGNRQPKIVQRTPLKFLERNQKNIEGDYSFTVDTANTGGVKVDGKIRRLTPTECERLQGFPDGWTEGVSDSQRYKCLGNAVSVPVIKAIIQKLI